MESQTYSLKHQRHRGLGELLSIENIPGGVLGKTKSGNFRVILFSDSVVQVQITDDDYFDELSYAVIATPGEPAFEIEDNPETIIIQTKELKVEIAKNPVRFTFYNSSGQLLNEDCPGFGISFLGSAKAIYKSLQEDERFIGLGEKTGNLDRKGSGYTNLNTDSFAYGTGADPLYCTFPFYIGIHNGLVYGIFVDNTYQSHFNFGASNDRFSSFSVEGGDMNYYFIHGSCVADIIREYTLLTGRMPMPPKWGLGYQQCRYSYYPDTEVFGLARTFREKQIPADVIVLDIHYMDQYKIFTWDSERFSNPEEMIRELEQMGFNIVVMCDPGIKIEKGYEAYEDGIENDLFLKYPDGTNYSGQVWPGWCHFPDFTKSDVRNWWGDKLKGYVDIGVKGYWNDMNEIATWGQKLPELIEFDFEGEGGSAKRGRNVYGLMMCRSTYEGVTHHLGDERPFNLTRAAYSGVQRYAAVWTGDNVANDDHMMLGVRLVNSLGLCGVAYSGYDVGGFVGDPSISLFARWISIGAFSPFFRGHSMVNSKDGEPWSYGEEVEDICRNYISLRYRMLPYLYSVFYEAATSGLPVARTLAIDYTFDDEISKPGYHNQSLFGPSILVAPVVSYQEITKVYLPLGTWYNFHTEEVYEGQSQIYVDCPITHLPLFVKAGAIIPMQSVTQSTMQAPDHVLQLHIYAGADGHFTYYEDDGRSYQYENGAFYLREISYDHQKQELSLSKVSGTFESRFSEVKCMLHGFRSSDKVKIKRSEKKLDKEELTFLPPVSSFDPLGKESISYPVEVKTVRFKNKSTEIKVSIGS